MVDAQPLDFADIRGEQIGNLVRGAAYVSGESGQKAVYTKKEATCWVCGHTESVDVTSDPVLLFKLLTHEPFDFKPGDDIAKCREGKRHRWELHEADPPLMFQEVFMRGSMDSSEFIGRSTNRDYHGFLLGEVPECKDVALEGIPFANGKTFDVEFLISKATPKSSSIDTFELVPEEVKELQAYFSGRETLSDFKPLAVKVNPRIAGHDDAKLAVMLTYASPTWLDVKGQLRPGTMRVLLFGDARQGKGSIEDNLRQKIALGKHAIGETSSRTGITYTIDRDRGIIIWGVMVEADRGLVVIEALHKFPPEDLATMRETLVKLYVEVRRAYTARAWARTRVIADSNGRQELALYLYPCQAVRDLPEFKDQVDLTRWDLFIAFRSGDIDADAILDAQLKATDDETFLRNMRKIALWMWSRRPEQIIFTADATEEARTAFKALLADYSFPEIPLVHEDSLLTILKIATAFAALSFSSIDGVSLEVKASHVKLAAEFLTETLDALELKEYRESQGETVITEEDLKGYYAYLDASDVAAKVVEAISKGPKNSGDLAAITGHEASSIRHVCSDLKAREVVERVSQGYRLTKKGVRLYREFHTTKATDSTGKVKGGSEK